MTVIAVIPARGGSKGVPGKNLRRVGGIPLVARAVAAARGAASVDVVVVSTDDDEIAAVAEEWGARVVRRPADLSGDTASSESALRHALESIGADAGTLAFLQATSPFISSADIEAGVVRVASGEADAAFSAVETYEFLWARGEKGRALAVNHDAAVRPRRQDREPHYRESGAFYVMDIAGFLAAGHRFFGRTAIVEVDESGGIEIDTPEQLDVARALAPLIDPQSGAIDADAVVTDFDGVHTDDTASIDSDGVEAVRVSRSDGMGIALLRRSGIPVAILSTETNPVVAARAAKLRVDVRHGLEDKAAALRAWSVERGIPLSRIAYVGNDVNDLACLELVGWPVAVPDAHPLVLAAARAVTGRPGGAGAVRDVAERVLRARQETEARPGRTERAHS